jgi:hypothetical protein
MDDENKPINPRKFKLWDTATLNSAMYSAAEIKHKLEEICNNTGLPVDEIKPTLIASDMLYLIVNSYVEAYEALMMENLLHLGSPHKTKPTIH